MVTKADVVPREHRSVIGRWDRHLATSPALLDATCPGRANPMHYRAEEAVGVVLGGVRERWLAPLSRERMVSAGMTPKSGWVARKVSTWCSFSSGRSEQVA